MKRLMRSPSKSTNETRPACLRCRDRKVRCDRRNLCCSNCAKLGPQACIYPAPDSSTRRKRGPYKKGRMHQPSEAKVTHQVQNEGIKLISRQGLASDVRKSTGEVVSHEDPISERLVQDALATFTPLPSTSGRFSTTRKTKAKLTSPSIYESSGASLTAYPIIDHIWWLWHLYVIRVDPLTKIIHCPTTAESFLQRVSRPAFLEDVTDALLFSIFYAAASSCTAEECKNDFDIDQRALLEHYGSILDSLLLCSRLAPSLLKMQATLIYLAALRRAPDQSEKCDYIFTIAMKLARELELDHENDMGISPFIREYRRRAWWMLCCLESSSAEECDWRQTTIMSSAEIPMPAALNDQDLDPLVHNVPKPRIGLSDMTFVLIFLKTVQLMYTMKLYRERADAHATATAAAEWEQERERIYRQTTSDIWNCVIQESDASRPFDWICIHYARGMLLKIRMEVEYPRQQISRADMPRQDRLALLYTSVELMKVTHAVQCQPTARNWAWYFRKYVQLHCLAVVISTIGMSQNKDFVTQAWESLAPMLADWERIYSTKASVPEWAHVHRLIQKARRAFDEQREGKGGSANIQPATPATVMSFSAHSEQTGPNSASHRRLTDAMVSACNDDGSNYTQERDSEDVAAYCDPFGLHDMSGYDFADTDFSNVDFAAFEHVWGDWLMHDIDFPVH